MDKLTQIFNNSLQTGFVDKNILSDLAYQPELLVNQKSPPKKVLSSILHELENCNQFYISVAFVTTSGVATIINKLKELENREIKGEILVSQYLNFTQPEALKYKTPSEFNLKSNGAYNAAHRQGLLDSVCSHMARLQHKKYTIQEIRKIALSYKTRNAFRKSSRGVYAAARSNNILDEVCKHMSRRKRSTNP